VIAAGLPAASGDHFLERCRDLEGWFRDGTLIDPRTAPMTEAYPSLHRDLERGRPTEIGSLNGAVVRRAERLGMEAPLNRLLTAEIVALVSGAMTPAEAARTPELQRRLRSTFAELAA
ncbi:MAG TPA: ketopantoate reductase C-terminal domain-containing protein, partial [Candidatus Limnocylindrales bacterium]|nr:ketopantoate reductase C-terminal domain-containing protein [Candidatus Limnocylindrales bacterium]